MRVSNLVHHALTEIRLAYREDCDALDGVDINDVIHSVEHFSTQGHSGGSAPYGAAKIAKDVADVTSEKQGEVVRKLCMFEPLTPLTGADDEWLVHDNDDDCYAQNVRCGHVFKRRDGTAFDVDAVVFRDPDGSTWTAVAESKLKPVVFPYTPKTEVVDRPAA